MSPEDKKRLKREREMWLAKQGHGPSPQDKAIRAAVKAEHAARVAAGIKYQKEQERRHRIVARMGDGFDAFDDGY